MVRYALLSGKLAPYIGDLLFMKIAVIFHRLGPYHHARLRAAGQFCELTAVELSAVDNTYAWTEVAGAENFQRVTIFRDMDVDEKSPIEIRQALWRDLDNCAPQVVAIPGWGGASALLALEWCRRKNIPAVVMSESTEIDGSRVRLKEWAKSKIVKQYSAALVGATPHIDYLAKLGLSRDRIFVGYDVVDNDYFIQGSDVARSRNEHLRKNKSLPNKFFLNSSRFIDKKNLARLIDAYARYRQAVGDDAWHLVIIGDGPLREELEGQISRLDLYSQIHLPGFKQYEELPDYYGLASAYVQASTTEQWGLVVNEAMASGLPVLVSERCGCTKDLVKSDVNGFTFNPYNIDELAGLLQKLSGNECNLAGMGQASRGIISHWTPATFAENLFKAACKATEVLPPKFSWLDRLLLKCLTRR